MRVAHKLGHVLGFWHEQSHRDQNDYVTIDVNNIISGCEKNFDKYDLKDGMDVDSYDYESIMHYGPFAFAKDPTKPTIIPNPNFKEQATDMGKQQYPHDS